MANLIPYLEFNGNCAEAMSFYKECLGGELFMQKISEVPGAENMPAEDLNKIMHASLNSKNIMLMGTDMRSDMTVGNANESNISLALVCNSTEEINTFFEKFSQGGKINQPLTEAFFGTYGELIDKYGFKWMFQYSADNKAE